MLPLRRAQDMPSTGSGRVEDFAPVYLDFDAEPFDDALLLDLREAFLVVAILIPSSSGMAPP